LLNRRKGHLFPQLGHSDSGLTAERGIWLFSFFGELRAHPFQSIVHCQSKTFRSILLLQVFNNLLQKIVTCHVPYLLRKENKSSCYSKLCPIPCIFALLGCWYALFFIVENFRFLYEFCFYVSL